MKDVIYFCTLLWKPVLVGVIMEGCPAKDVESRRGHEDAQRLEHICCADRLGVFSLEKAPGGPYFSLSVPKWACRKSERGSLSVTAIAQGVKALN